MKKEELIAFVEYLRNKDEVYIDDRIVYTGLLCRRVYNLREMATGVVKSIRKAKSTDDAIKKLSMCLGYSNCLWKLRPDLLFHEDLEEYLRSLGYSNDQVYDVSTAILGGSFKLKSKSEKQYKDLFKDDANMRRWACAVRHMPKRNTLAMYLPSEYDNFCNDEIFDLKELPGPVGGMFSSSRYIYFNIEYTAKTTATGMRQRLELPCYILVFSNDFQDERLLNKMVEDWFETNVARYSFENKIIVGKFVRCTIAGNGLTFDGSSLGVASNMITFNMFKKFANNIMRDLNIKNAYFKDGFGQKLYWLTLSKADEKTIAKKEREEAIEWCKLEDKADKLYLKVQEWAKGQDVVEFKNVQKHFKCGEDEAIELCRMLFENNVTDWYGNVRKHPTKCAMCGKEFDYWDYNESAHIRHAFGYGSKHDNNKIDAWLCINCADKVMDTILPLFKEDPLEHYEDLPPATYTDEEIAEIEKIIESRENSDLET